MVEPIQKDSTRQSEFFRGMRNTIPLLVGALPFGMIYGALGISAGLSPAAVIGMSLIVFAGSAQFIAVGLFAAHTPIIIIILTTFIVNLRHLLYSLNLLPEMKPLAFRWKIPLAFWLTDETFTVSVLRYQEIDSSPNKHWFQLGSSLAMYLNWQLWTIAGVLLGAQIPNAEAWGLDVAMPVTFIGMLIPFVRSIPVLVSVVVAGILSILTHDFPLNTGLILSVVVGIAAGMAVDYRKSLQVKGEDNDR
ncbi:AzlC family ABC transporter permease [bacterium]|nr:AzlC family ABC transporter permease [bacterium]